MSRRSFIRNMGFKFGTISKEVFSIPTSFEDRVLVIIRLNGGNDGLNTVIPLDKYDNLVMHRPNIILPQSALLNITPTLALHKNMTGAKKLFQEGKFSIVQNVGYPNQNRSHFQSTDIWSTGIVGQNATLGWLGKKFDSDYPGFPDEYPNDTYKDPFAIALGNEVSATCQGLEGNFSVALENPFEEIDLFESNTVNDNSYYGNHVTYLSNIIAQSNAYGIKINEAANAGNSLSNLYDMNNELAVQLKYVAQMISGGLQTKVYVLSLDGFDTHNAQTTNTDVTIGKHAELLKSLSDAIEAFQDDIEKLGISERVAGMTFSEFGRQIGSNGSFGTDHGDAAPLFLFGSCLTSPVVGTNPEIPDTELNQEGVEMKIDFRDIYASVLKDWFNTSESQIQSLFQHEVKYYPILNSCNEGNRLEADELILYPNPCDVEMKVKFTSEEELVSIKVVSITGQTLGTFYSETLNRGNHTVTINVSRFTTGTYVLMVEKNSGILSKKFIKVKTL
jgi:uncharacterized protein (DUF1501 family)